jgi:hypothetical protein
MKVRVNNRVALPVHPIRHLLVSARNRSMLELTIDLP